MPLNLVALTKALSDSVNTKMTGYYCTSRHCMHIAQSTRHAHFCARAIYFYIDPSALPILGPERLYVRKSIYN